MILKNKKGNLGLRIFIFSFLITIISGFFFFLSVDLHFLIYDYGLQPVINLANSTLGVSGEATAGINSLGSKYLGLTQYMDWFFGVLLLSTFISGIIASIQAKKYGIISFFGMVTIGNLFLLFLINYAMEVRGWFLNNIAYAILVGDVNMPILEFFYNYTPFVLIVFALVFLGVNQMDLEKIKEKLPSVFSQEKETSGFSLGGGKFEE